MSYLTIYTGPMFSGKSTQLITQIHNATHSHVDFVVIKPERDTRNIGCVAARQKAPLAKKFEPRADALSSAHTVATYDDVMRILNEKPHQMLFADEVQFFDPWFVDLIQELLYQPRDSSFKIYLAGLDMNYMRQPFGIMPQLLAIADEVVKCKAICFKCSTIRKQPVQAGITQSLKPLTSTIVVGDAETYEARCRACHTIPE